MRALVNKDKYIVIIWYIKMSLVVLVQIFRLYSKYLIKIIAKFQFIFDCVYDCYR